MIAPSNDKRESRRARVAASIRSYSVKITDIRTAVIEGNFPWVLVRVYTDEGIIGLGEAYWGAGVADLVHKAKSVLIGENPFNISKAVEVMIRCLASEGSLAGATVTAISGI